LSAITTSRDAMADKSELSKWSAGFFSQILWQSILLGYCLSDDMSCEDMTPVNRAHKTTLQC